MTTPEEPKQTLSPEDGANKSKISEDEQSKEKSKSDKEKEEAKAAPVSNYWRILSFGTRATHCLLLVALTAAAASGTALPLMNIFFGRLVGDFNGYFIPDNGITKSEFKKSVSDNALIIVYLFIGKFFLTYIAMVCTQGHWTM